MDRIKAAERLHPGALEANGTSYEEILSKEISSKWDKLPLAGRLDLLVLYLGEDTWFTERGASTSAEAYQDQTVWIPWIIKAKDSGIDVIRYEKYVKAYRKKLGQKSTRPGITPRKLAKTLMSRQHYHFADAILWVYQDGVYVRDEGRINSECLKLLGNEWTSSRRNEAIKYVQDAQRVRDWHEDQPRYLNLRNGLYDLTTGGLGPHDPA